MTPSTMPGHPGSSTLHWNKELCIFMLELAVCLAPSICTRTEAIGNILQLKED